MRTYEKLQEQFKMLKTINPNDNLLKYQDEVKARKVSLWEESPEYHEFIEMFGIAYGSPHSSVLSVCLSTVKSRVEELRAQKPSPLETKTTTN